MLYLYFQFGSEQVQEVAEYQQDLIHDRLAERYGWTVEYIDALPYDKVMRLMAIPNAMIEAKKAMKS